MKNDVGAEIADFSCRVASRTPHRKPQPSSLFTRTNSDSFHSFATSAALSYPWRLTITRCSNSVLASGEEKCFAHESDGVRGASPTCCAGVSIGEAFRPEKKKLPLRPIAARKLLESACDALGPAGGHATESVPGATCLGDTGAYVKPFS